MMKFVVCILAICCFGISYGVQYNTFGMRKSVKVVLKEFAESFNKIIGSIGYIQFYDVSKPVNIMPITADLTLSSIEMSNLKIAKPLADKDLTYAYADAKATIKTAAKLDLALAADFNLKWSYKYDGSVVYSGTYSAKLATTAASATFELMNETPQSTGKITFTWGINSPIIKGFGANDQMLTHIKDLIIEKLYPVFQEELNRFNDIIVSSMVYNYFFRKIPIGLTTPQKDEVSIKNVHKKFVLSDEYVSFVYNSTLYFSIQHVDMPLDFPFTPAEDASDMALFFGYGASSSIYDMVVKVSPQVHIEIDAAKQTELLGYPITVAKLAEFYPKLAEDYEPNSKTLITCDLLASMGDAKTYNFKCYITLADSRSDILFDITNLKWASNMAVTSTDGKNMVWGLSKFYYPEILIKSPRLNEATKATFLEFLQPLARYPEKSTDFTVGILGGTAINWAFKGTSKDVSDLSIYYSA